MGDAFSPGHKGHSQGDRTKVRLLPSGLSDCFPKKYYTAREEYRKKNMERGLRGKHKSTSRRIRIDP